MDINTVKNWFTLFNSTSTARVYNIQKRVDKLRVRDCDGLHAQHQPPVVHHRERQEAEQGSIHQGASHCSRQLLLSYLQMFKCRV